MKIYQQKKSLKIWRIWVYNLKKFIQLTNEESTKEDVTKDKYTKEKNTKEYKKTKDKLKVEYLN